MKRLNAKAVLDILDPTVEMSSFPHTMPNTKIYNYQGLNLSLILARNRP